MKLVAALGAACAAAMTVTTVVTVVAGGDDPAQAAGLCLPTQQVGDHTLNGVNLTPEQASNAAVIVAVANQGITIDHRSVTIPPRGQIIAIATALQESDLINVRGGDRDSVGLFQQRPSQGWGDSAAFPGDARTPRQRLLDPTYAATRFYIALLRIPDWQALPLTVAAQAVQRSAFPDAYAKHEARASRIVDVLHSSTACTADAGDDASYVGKPGIPRGYAVPPDAAPQARVAINYALNQLGEPYVWGATGPDAWDCSSLMQAAYRQAGIGISRVTSDQVHDGHAATLATIAPGDLVFVPRTSTRRGSSPVGHVGMYIGEGLIVQATHTGDYVRVTPLKRWISRISAIRRVV